MKRYIKSARNVSRSWLGDRLNYDAVDTVIEYLEDIITKIETHQDVNIKIQSGYNSFPRNKCFIIECIIEQGSIIETPKGNIFEINRGSNSINLISPKQIDSPYGPVDTSGFYAYGMPSSIILQLKVSNSYYDDAEVILRSTGEVISDLNELEHLLVDRIDEFKAEMDVFLDKEFAYRIKRAKEDAEAAEKKRQMREDKKMSQPLTLKNIDSVLSAFKKLSDNKLARKGDYIRVTSFENDFVSYYNINDIIDYANKNDIVLGDALDDPDVILEADTIGSYGISHAFEEDSYNAYKKSMNAKLGFTR